MTPPITQPTLPGASGDSAAYPATIDDLRVELTSLATPSPGECAAITQRIASYNLALVAAPPHQITPEAILAFGRVLGLKTADSNLFADHRAISTITAGGTDDRADYIPYTTKALSWHTDGYYNAPRRPQVRAWTLFCVRPAAAGGAQQSPGPAATGLHPPARLTPPTPTPGALTHPQALTIPANIQSGKVLRPESTGPVCSCDPRRACTRATPPAPRT